MDGLGLHNATPAQLQARLALEAQGTCFLAWRAEDGERLLALEQQTGVTVGRGPAVDVALDADSEVSRLHAELQPIGGAWVIVDDGLSSNGSFVNDERVSGRRRLRDSDLLRFGSTPVLFRAPGADELGETRPATQLPMPDLSATQRKVLVAVCRPYREGGAYARPASNRAVAEEVFLGPDAVKSHMRVLYEKLGVQDEPQAEKRLRLVERAFRSGLISHRDL